MKINYFILRKNNLQGRLIYKAFVYDLNKIILICATIYSFTAGLERVICKDCVYISQEVGQPSALPHIIGFFTSISIIVGLLFCIPQYYILVNISFIFFGVKIIYFWFK